MFPLNNLAYKGQGTDKYSIESKQINDIMS